MDLRKLLKESLERAFEGFSPLVRYEELRADKRLFQSTSRSGSVRLPDKERVSGGGIAAEERKENEKKKNPKEIVCDVTLRSCVL